MGIVFTFQTVLKDDYRTNMIYMKASEGINLVYMLSVNVVCKSPEKSEKSKTLAILMDRKFIHTFHS